MPDLGTFFRHAPHNEFSGTVYRICTAQYGGNIVSMRGALLYGARYNIRGYFGALYTSLSLETARQEMAQYFTVPPIGGFVEACIELKLNRVVDLTDRRVLRKAGMLWDQLIEPRHTISQEVGLRAWENGIEGLLAPSAANPSEQNVVVFLDNQHPVWKVELTSLH
jgi:RES domain-containing protein